MERQTEIDWTRASQLAMLRDMRLETLRAADGTAVRPKVLLAVLRMIDEHGRGREAWVSYETLATKTGLGARSVKRAVEVLVEASLLCVETKRSVHGVVCNHYRIVWSELALRCSPPMIAERPERRPERGANGAERSAVATERSAVATERSAVATERSAVATPAECRGDTQTAIPHVNRFEPPPQPPTATTEAWAAAAAKWSDRLADAKQLAAEACTAGEKPDAWEARVQQAWQLANHPTNRLKLRSVAGAVAWFLRRGTWPVDGLVGADRRVDQDAEERRRRAAAADLESRARTLFFLMRRRQASDADIVGAIARQFGPAMCERLGLGAEVSRETGGGRHD